MQLKVAICEDNKSDSEIIRKYLEVYSKENSVSFDVSTFLSDDELREQYKRLGDFHLLFLCMEISGKTGLEIASHLRNHLNDRRVKIIFTSKNCDYMQLSFTVQPYHYFVKPIDAESFFEVMDRIVLDMRSNESIRLMIQENGSEELVYVDDICFIHVLDAKKKRLEVNVRDQTLYITGRLSHWEEDLKKYYFIPTSRSYLVSLRHIHYIRTDSVVLDNGTVLSLSRRNGRELRKFLHRNRLIQITDHY